MAQHTGLATSSVHRRQQAMERRNRHPESWLWETEDGRQWLTRLVVAPRYTFGLKRGVGLDPLSAWFTRLPLATQVGCSPAALRGVRQTLAAALLETAATWEQAECASGKVRESIGAGDATFVARLLLVCMDLATGSLLLAEVAAERTYTPWKALGEARLKALSAGVLSMVSDCAQALMQLAEHGLECLSVPEFFHVVHDLVKSYAVALGRHRRQAHQELTKATEALVRRQARSHKTPAVLAATAGGAARHAEVAHWETVPPPYRHHLETRSLTLHPFRITDSPPPPSDQVAHHVDAAVTALAALARPHPLPARPHAMVKVRTQSPALAAVVDVWWQGVWQDMAPFVLAPRGRQWGQEGVLPLVYGEPQVAHTRCPRRKAKRRQALEAVHTAFETQAITRGLARHVRAAWRAWASLRVQVFARASSAVEGRNGSLSQMQHNQRGLPRRRYQVWTVLYNFDCYAADGPTPAARFFGRSFPDLFETV